MSKVFNIWFHSTIIKVILKFVRNVEREEKFEKCIDVHYIKVSHVPHILNADKIRTIFPRNCFPKMFSAICRGCIFKVCQFKFLESNFAFYKKNISN